MEEIFTVNMIAFYKSIRSLLKKKRVLQKENDTRF